MSDIQDLKNCNFCERKFFSKIALKIHLEKGHENQLSNTEKVQVKETETETGTGTGTKTETETSQRNRNTEEVQVKETEKSKQSIGLIQTSTKCQAKFKNPQKNISRKKEFFSMFHLQ